MKARTVVSGLVATVAASTIAIGTVSAQTPQFPAIVHMAMSHFSSYVLRGAQAPGVYPKAASGSNQLFYRTFSTTQPGMSSTGLQASYMVTLSSPHNTLANFSGTRFDTAQHAVQNIASNLGNVSQVSGMLHREMLNYQHPVTWAFDSKNSTSTLVWHEGRWHIKVSETGVTSMPTAMANAVIDYLQTHYMPAPRNAGDIVVTQKGTQVDVSVIRQDGNEVYSASTNQFTADPIQTALAMMYTMKTYTAG